MICERCGGDRRQAEGTGLECLCGNTDFELGGIFAAHSMALHAIECRKPLAEIERLTARTLERIDMAKHHIGRRMERVRAAVRSGRPS